MNVRSLTSRCSVIQSVYICCVLTLTSITNLHAQETEPSEREDSLQVDVITYRFRGAPPQTVDLRIVARDLLNQPLFDKAIDALSSTGNAFISSGTVDLLTRAMNDDDHEIRQRAIDLLGYSRNPEAIPIITYALQNDKAWRVRRLAAHQLGPLAGEAAVPALIAVLAERPTKDSPPEYLDYYGNYGHDVVRGAISGLASAGGDGIPILIKMLEDEIEEHGGQRRANSLLQSLAVSLDRRIIPPLINIISKPSSSSDRSWASVREHAARILTRLASDSIYAIRLRIRNDLLAKGLPNAPAKNRLVTPKDRIRVRESLQSAGFEIN